jgi:hypothetical protein
MVLVSVWLSAALIAQAATPLQRFNRSPGDDHYAKMRIISEAVLGKTPASPAQVEELLAAAMKDPDPAVRRQAVGSMSSIILFTSMPSVPPGQEWAAALQPIVKRLVFVFDSDPDATVRSFAVTGLLSAYSSTDGEGAGGPDTQDAGSYDREDQGAAFAHTTPARPRKPFCCPSRSPGSPRAPPCPMGTPRSTGS